MKIPKIIKECKQKCINNGEDIAMLEEEVDCGELVPAELAKDFTFYYWVYIGEFNTDEGSVESFLLIVNEYNSQYNSLLDAGYSESEAEALLKLVM